MDFLVDFEFESRICFTTPTNATFKKSHHMLINSSWWPKFSNHGLVLLVGWEFYEQCRYIDKPRKLTLDLREES